MNRRFVLLGSLLVLSLSSVIVSTYAITDVSRYVRIDFDNVNVAGDAKVDVGIRNLETDEIVYFNGKDKIEDSDFKDNHHKIDFKYKPVSQAFNSDYFKKNENGYYDDDCFPGFSKDAKVFPRDTHYKATEGFRQFELFFKVDKNQPIKIKLSNQTNFLPNYEKNKHLSETYGLNLEDLNSVTNSLRMSILTKDNYITIEPKKDKDTYLGGRLKDSEEYYEVETETKHEICYGEVVRDKLVYSTELLESDIGELSKNSVFIGKSRKGTYPLDEEASIANGAIRKEDSISLKEAVDQGYFIRNYTVDKDGNYEVFDTIRTVISIYFEGWDRDNTNSIAYGYFNSNIQFVCDYADDEIIGR